MISLHQLMPCVEEHRDNIDDIFASAYALCGRTQGQVKMLTQSSTYAPELYTASYLLRVVAQPLHIKIYPGHHPWHNNGA